MTDENNLRRIYMVFLVICKRDWSIGYSGLEGVTTETLNGLGNVKLYVVNVLSL